MKLEDRIEYLLEIGSASPWGERISAELAYAKSLSDVKEGCYDRLIEQTVSALLRDVDDAGGVITKDAAMRAENALLVLSEAAKSYRVHCIAHAHIDMNWQWGYQETAAITVDTFRTVLDLMREYPTLTFGQSQAATYRIIEEFAPEMLEEIRERVREGRWEVSASTWVETDKNMPSGESLARHILYTRRYLSKLLDIPAESLDFDFEPDTFGHAASVPEICAKGGVKYYYHCRGYRGDEFAYRWRSPSGAELLAWRESEWYNYTIVPTMFRPVPIRCARYGIDCFLSVYGVGDHGGGPTRRDVERLLEYAEWPIMPTILFSTYGAFYRDLERFRDVLPVREGEQNFVFTGCYTSQSRIKMANRVAENRMYESEFLASAATVYGGAPKRNEAFAESWKKILFNQFHDILPGSGVIDTREYALGQFQHAMGAIQTNANLSMRALAEAIDISSLGVTLDRNAVSEGAGGGYLTGYAGGYAMPASERGTGKKRVFHFFNSTQYDYEGVGEITVWDWDYDGHRAEFCDAEGRETSYQIVKSGKHYWGHRYHVFAVKVRVPALGYATYTLDEKERSAYVPEKRRDPLTDLYSDGAIVLENDKIRAVFDRMTMQLCSLVERSGGKELLKAPAGTFRLIRENTVHKMTSWRVGEYMSAEALNETCDVCVSEVSLSGIRQYIRYSLAYGHGSTMEVTVRLDEGSSVLLYDVSTDFLEVGDKNSVVPQLNFTLPVGYAVSAYRYDIPFGTLERTELFHDVPANAYGVALPERGSDAPAVGLLSDSKYGFRGAQDSLSLSLLRASCDPDPYPELGRHHFRIGVGVSANCGYESVDAMKKHFAHPLAVCSARASEKGALPLDGRFLTVSGNVCVEAVKCAEDTDGLVIRLSACGEAASEFALSFAKSPTAAYEADLNETVTAPLEQKDCTVYGRVEAFGVKTVLVRF